MPRQRRSTEWPRPTRRLPQRRRERDRAPIACASVTVGIASSCSSPHLNSNSTGGLRTVSASTSVRRARSARSANTDMDRWLSVRRRAGRRNAARHAQAWLRTLRGREGFSLYLSDYLPSPPWSGKGTFSFGRRRQRSVGLEARTLAAHASCGYRDIPILVWGFPYSKPISVRPSLAEAARVLL